MARYKIIIEGETMGQVQGSFTLVVNPASSGTPLLIDPSTGTLLPETEGVADPGQVVATVKGGVPPYTFSATGVPTGDNLSQQPSADGAAGDVDIILSGTPAVGDAASSPFTLAITATDSASPTASVTKRIAVTRRG